MPKPKIRILRSNYGGYRYQLMNAIVGGKHITPEFNITKSVDVLFDKIKHTEGVGFV